MPRLAYQLSATRVIMHAATPMGINSSSDARPGFSQSTAGSGARGTRGAFRLRKVRDLAEELEALIDLLLGDVLQALRAEALHSKRTHHAAIEHRGTEDRRRKLR